MKKLFLIAASAYLFFAFNAAAEPSKSCEGLPTHDQLKAAVSGAQAQNNGGSGNQMWGVVVNRDGIVCAVVFTGKDRGDQWPGSRLIAAGKANTANAFSLPGMALSTANLYASSQPSGPLYGLALSSPPNPQVAFAGPPEAFGQPNDPLVGQPVGGGIIFGGGLALYSKGKKLIGALGVSGDTSCADHNIAWRARNALKLDYVPSGVTSDKKRPDNIIYDMTKLSGTSVGVSASGWGHPACNGDVPHIAEGLPPVSAE